MNAQIVFYSWQSDLPNATNRGFIQKALENAAKAIHDDESIEVQPVIDRDTAGIPGTPDIAETIFAKIDRCDIFVWDVSIINRDQPCPAPNPNVLIELDYARKTLSFDQVVMVMNTAFGSPELLPFDLRSKRVVTYAMLSENEGRATERKRLEAVLEESLRLIFDRSGMNKSKDDDTYTRAKDVAFKALENSLPSQTMLVSRYLQLLWEKFDHLAPEFPGTARDDADELLVQTIAKTESLIVDFAQLCELIAATNAVEAANQLYKDFSHLLEQLNPPVGFSGTFYSTHADFYQFTADELFVVFISSLLRAGRHTLIADLLETEIYVRNSPSGSGTLPFTFISDGVDLLRYRNQRLKLNRISIHADILNERHTKGDIAKVAPMEQFIEADYFLYLRKGLSWRPWSTLYMKGEAPRFLAEAVQRKYAEQLLRPLRIKDIEDFRKLIPERNTGLRQLFSHYHFFLPLEDFRHQTIGSK